MGRANVRDGDRQPFARLVLRRRASRYRRGRRYALAQLAQGADIIDVGAESTRPGYRPIDGATERARLLPAAALRAAAPQAIVSVDTFKADVFRAAHAAGGDLLNSIWGAPDDLIAAAVETGSPS